MFYVMNLIMNFILYKKEERRKEKINVWGKLEIKMSFTAVYKLRI